MSHGDSRRWCTWTFVSSSVNVFKDLLSNSSQARTRSNKSETIFSCKNIRHSDHHLLNSQLHLRSNSSFLCWNFLRLWVGVRKNFVSNISSSLLSSRIFVHFKVSQTTFHTQFTWGLQTLVSHELRMAMNTQRNNKFKTNFPCIPT